MKLNESKMACRGADTVSIRCAGSHMEQCVACEKSVAWNMVDHFFFGFQTCEHAKPDEDAAEKAREK